jgi:hypothetical protein
VHCIINKPKGWGVGRGERGEREAAKVNYYNSVF